jgi:hypothetical protein
MTVELVLLLGIYAFLILGAFLGDLGPIETFRKSAPRLGARIERNISTGDGFRNSSDGQPVNWIKPEGPQGGP